MPTGPGLASEAAATFGKRQSTLPSFPTCFTVTSTQSRARPVASTTAYAH